MPTCFEQTRRTLKANVDACAKKVWSASVMKVCAKVVVREKLL